MQMHPCGCSLKHDAEREPDPDGRTEKQRIADEFARGWRCPIAMGEPSFGAVGPCDRDGGRGETIAAVERLTGADLSDVTTCPVVMAYRDDVHRAMRAWRWRRRGGIRNVEPNPPAALLDAVDEIDAGVEACKAEAERRAAQKMRDEMEARRG